MLKLGAVVLDSANSEQLSDFYARLLKWKKLRIDNEWITVFPENKSGLSLVFQEISSYTPPVWPTTYEKQQQMIHLDFYTDNVPEAVAYAQSCGATKSPVQLDSSWTVLLDPAGHPFCILPNTPPEQ